MNKKEYFLAEIVESPMLDKMDNHVRKSSLERTLLSRMQAKELTEEVGDEEVIQCAHQVEVLKPLFSSTRRINLNKSEVGGEETSKDSKPRLVHWILLKQEFDMEIRDKKGKRHLIIHHFSRLKFDEDDQDVESILEVFLDEKLLVINALPWVADFANFKAESSSLHKQSYFQHRQQSTASTTSNFVSSIPSILSYFLYVQKNINI